MPERLEPMKINVEERLDGLYLAHRVWPEQAEFARDVLESRPKELRYWRGHVQLKLRNGRAVYRLAEYLATTKTYVGFLVYSEGPDAG